MPVEENDNDVDTSVDEGVRNDSADIASHSDFDQFNLNVYKNLNK